VAIGNVFGRNRAYIEEHLPHVFQGMAGDLDDAVRGADVVIVGKRLPGHERLAQLVRDGQTVIDLAGIDGVPAALRPWAAQDSGSARAGLGSSSAERAVKRG
jgi:hypothetical protein